MQKFEENEKLLNPNDIDKMSCSPYAIASIEP